MSEVAPYARLLLGLVYGGNSLIETRRLLGPVLVGGGLLVLLGLVVGVLLPALLRIRVRVPAILRGRLLLGKSIQRSVFSG
jgi:hypothetical protein